MPRPLRGLRLHESDWQAIPLHLGFCGFALFWESAAVEDGSLLLELWGIPFVFFGIYDVLGRFFHEAWQRRRTWYGLTGTRAVIVTQNWRVREVSVAPRAVSELRLETRSDGFGTIHVGRRAGKRESAPPAFDLILDAERVYQLLTGQ